jgi:hypothetical protein
MRPTHLLALFTIFLGCTEEPLPRIEFTLREVQRFGDEVLGPADSTALDRHFGAGILADVASIVVDSSGILTVLDRDWVKIVRFGPSGDFLGLVEGGRGEGPGEFMLPIHLTRRSDGHLSALDYELGRVTWFNEGSEPTVIPLNRGGFFEHLVLGDTILLTRPNSNARRRAFVTIFSTAGDSIGASPLLPEEDRAFGAPRSMTGGPNGTVLVNTKRPGVWMERAGGRWNRRGTPLFPEALPPQEDSVSAREIRVTPSQVSSAGIAATPDGLVVQGFMRFPRPFSWDDPTSREEPEWYLAFFLPDGHHLGSVRLPPGVHSVCLIANPASGSLYLCSTDPFPQVIEYPPVSE